MLKKLIFLIMLLSMQLVFADIKDIKELEKAMDDLSFEESAVSGFKTTYKVGISKYTFYRLYKSQVHYLNGKREGEAKFYYKNGNLIGKGNYKNDKKDGLWEFFASDGGKIVEVNYKNGLFDGIVTEYFENGQINTVSNYVQGKKEGEEKQYYMSGKL